MSLFNALNFSYIFSILFLVFWNFFTIINLNYFTHALPISFSFIQSCTFLLVPSSVTCFFFFFFCHLFIYLDDGDCASALLVVWLDASSNGVFKQLSRAKSYCWDVYLWDTSLWLIFPEAWHSLLFQQFRLSAPTIVAQAWFLDPEWGSYKPCGSGEIKDKGKKLIQNIINLES